MKHYEITAQRANGTEFKDIVYAENEKAARRDFNEIYRHCDGYKITSIKVREEERKMADLEKVLKILNGSVRYELHGGVLTLTGYYTGEEVKLDLNKLTEETLEELTPDEEEEEEDEWA